MIDMKLTEEEKKDFVNPAPRQPRYPHGLMISLNKEELEKLGIQDPPSVGEKMKLEATVEVVGVDVQGETGDQKELCCRLQIKEMDLKKEKKEENAETVIYGG
jgi:hypothetical protein